uniref:Protein kinase domain-containing protein n=1 Tax=Amphiprion percula TaxID=161767 RepID=A0A3P8S7Z8_AMPPE
ITLKYCTRSDLARYFLLSLRFRYSEDDVVTYIVQILQGLDYLHTRRILHLDIKPENVIVTYMNIIKIIDFGSAQTYNPLFLKLSGRSPFMENDPQETEARIQAAKSDLSKLYQNVSQSASLFLKKILCSYPW